MRQEVFIRWNGRFRKEGGVGWRVEGGREVAVTSREALSDLRQISEEMSGVHPLVTVACDSSALAGFNLR